MSLRSAAAVAIGLLTVTAHGEESSLSASDIEARGITGLDGIAAAVPAISYTPALNSIDTLSIYMRGEGPTAAGQITLDGAVGVYQDGFLVPRLQANTFDLFDLERVQVLAGPQGALYGRDTAGGVINLTSKAPTGELRFDQTVDFGNLDSYRVLSSLDAPRWHGIAAKVLLLASSIDGYVNNADAQQRAYGSEKQRAARLELRWDGLSSLRADYFFERNSFDSTPEYLSNPPENGEELLNGFTYYANPDGPPKTTYRPVFLPLSTSNHTAQGLTLTWHPWSALTVQSLTGYRTMDANEQQDTAEFFGFALQTGDLYQDHLFSQELRFSGELFDRQIGYLLGASYLRETGQHDNNVVEPVADAEESRDVSMTSRSQAVYAQLHWRPDFLGRHLEIEAAGRYTKDSKDAERDIDVVGVESLESGVLNHLSYNRATPEGTLTYHWTDGISTYAKVATAYEAGGALETALPGDFSSSTFRPEASTTYEVGLKSAFLHDRLMADIAVFDSRRKDVQYAIPLNFYQDQVFDFQRVTVKGASLALRATPLHDLALSANVEYLHADIDRADALAGSVFDPASVSGLPYVVGENVKSVFALPYTPKYSGSLAGDYTLLHFIRSDVFLHLDYVYRARMFAQAAAGPGIAGGQFDTQGAYGLLNGRITLSKETDWAHRVKFSLWGRNLLNRQYYQQAVGIGGGLENLNAAGTALGGYTARAGAWAEPRTYGLTVKYEY